MPAVGFRKSFRTMIQRLHLPRRALVSFAMTIPRKRFGIRSSAPVPFLAIARFGPASSAAQWSADFPGQLPRSATKDCTAVLSARRKSPPENSWLARMLWRDLLPRVLDAQKRVPPLLGVGCWEHRLPSLCATQVF